MRKSLQFASTLLLVISSLLVGCTLDSRKIDVSKEVLYSEAINSMQLSMENYVDYFENEVFSGYDVNLATDLIPLVYDNSVLIYEDDFVRFYGISVRCDRASINFDTSHSLLGKFLSVEIKFYDEDRKLLCSDTVSLDYYNPKELKTLSFTIPIGARYLSLGEVYFDSISPDALVYADFSVLHPLDYKLDNEFVKVSLKKKGINRIKGTIKHSDDFVVYLYLHNHYGEIIHCEKMEQDRIDSYVDYGAVYYSLICVY